MAHSLIHRKITSGQLFDCNNLQPFIDSIVAILPYQGISGSHFFTCEKDNVQFLTKLSFFRKNSPELYGGIRSDLQHTVDTEITVLKLLREEFILTGMTPGILEIIYDKVCSDWSKIIPSDLTCARLMPPTNTTNPEDHINTILCENRDLVAAGIAHEKFAFIVMERCDITFDSFMGRMTFTSMQVAVFKSLLFQIVQTNCAIRSKYPGYRHYDLHTNNIMIKFDTNYKFRANVPKYLVYHCGDKTYNVPYFGLHTKIIDFGFATIPEKEIKPYSTADRNLMHIRTDNDILHMMVHIYNRLSSSPAIDKILASMDPTRSYMKYYQPMIKGIAAEINTPEQMLAAPTFNEYLKTTIAPTDIYSEYTY